MRLSLTMAVVFWLGGAPFVRGQAFDSGSNGSDGTLTLMTPGIVVFDEPALNAKGGNIYHFKSIMIGAGVTVKMSSKNLHGPIFWLSQGPVEIDGTIDLDGEDGKAAGSMRIPTSPGAGGYGGGVPAGNGNDAQAGFGPGGGAPGLGGSFTGNGLLVPLVGGSGGGGVPGAGGGAGGGALLIASSTSITVNGTISANGGNQADAGFLAAGGAGGAIRLVAPYVTGSGAVLRARGGMASGGVYAGQDGRIRVEAFRNDLRGDVNGTPVSIGKPFKLFLPSEGVPWVRVVSVGGAAVETESGLAKVTNGQGKPVVLVLEAHHVAVGTVIRVHLYSDGGKDQVVESTKLAGDFETSRATVTVAPMGSGLTHVAIEANWESAPVTGRRANDGGRMKAGLRVRNGAAQGMK